MSLAECAPVRTYLSLKAPRVGCSGSGTSNVRGSGENLDVRHFVVGARPWGVVGGIAMTAVSSVLAAHSEWFGLPLLIAAIGTATVVGAIPR